MRAQHGVALGHVGAGHQHRHGSQMAVERHRRPLVRRALPVTAPGEQRLAPRQDVAGFDRRSQPERSELAAHRARRARAAVEAHGVVVRDEERGTGLAGQLRGDDLRALRHADAEAQLLPQPLCHRTGDRARHLRVAAAQLGARQDDVAIGPCGEGQRRGHAARAHRHVADMLGQGRGQHRRRAAADQRACQVHGEGAVVTVDHHRPQCADAGIAHRRRQRAVGAGRDGHGRSRDGGGAERLERAGQVEHALTIDRVDSRRAGVAGALIEDADDLRAGQVGERLRQQRDGADDLWCRERRAGPIVADAGLVGRAHPLADRGQEVGGGIAGAVAERRDGIGPGGAVGVGADGARDDHQVARARAVGKFGRVLRIGAAVVARRDDDNDPRRGCAVDRLDQRVGGIVGAAQRDVDDPRAVASRDVDAAGDVVVVERTAAIRAADRDGDAGAGRVGAQHQ